jgi:long-chain acyl-CoA synthetase
MTAPFDTLAALSEHHARERPGAIATVFGDRRLSYAELHGNVCRTVAALRAAGIGAGDRVGYFALNDDRYVELLLACFRVGAVLVAINWRLVPREVAYILQDAGIRLLVTEGQFLPIVDAARAGTGIARIILLDGPHEGGPDFAAWRDGHAPDEASHDVRSHDVAVQMYTSGTTGFPKGALITHRNILGTVEKTALVGERWGETDEGDHLLVSMPMFHISGTGYLLHALVPGATAVILPRPDVGDIATAIAQHRIKRVFAVPAVLNMILDHPAAADADFGSVEALLYGASPIPLDVLRRSMRKFPNAAFVQCYGATETTGTVVYLAPDDHHLDGTPRMLSCGRPYPGNEVRIVGEDGATLPARAVGEIAIRSVSVMAGYHNKPEATDKAIRDGWYLTGDAGYLDEDGYLYIFDRVKDMIVSGAENVYPAEVENALHEHPGVRDCAVIGVPDARWGEAVKAVVVRAPGAAVSADELIAFARERIAGYKVPKSVDFIDELPRNASGKILKRELRKPYWPEGGRQVG